MFEKHLVCPVVSGGADEEQVRGVAWSSHAIAVASKCQADVGSGDGILALPALDDPVSANAVATRW